ncbi:MAG: carboxymuconolactone decarboxylase family protein [Gemmatimonadaceae bacterium]
MARRLGASDDQLMGVSRADYSDLEPAWRSALVFADAMTPTRGDVTSEIFDDLAAAWTQAQIIEIAAVVALFNYFNRFAVALRIPVTR